MGQLLGRFWHLVLHRLVTGGGLRMHRIFGPDPHRHVQRDGGLGLREPYRNLPALGRHHGIGLLLHEHGACGQPGLHAERGRLRHRSGAHPDGFGLRRLLLQLAGFRVWRLHGRNRHLGIYGLGPDLWLGRLHPDACRELRTEQQLSDPDTDRHLLKERWHDGSRQLLPDER